MVKDRWGLELLTRKETQYTVRPSLSHFHPYCKLGTLAVSSHQPLITHSLNVFSLSSLTVVLVRVSIAVMKHHDHSYSYVGRKGFIWLILPRQSMSSKNIRTETQAGQESRSRNRCRGHGGMLLMGLIVMTCSAFFLIEPGTTRPGVVPTTMGLPLPRELIHPIINKLIK